MEKIHIGEIISRKLKEKYLTKKWLAKQIHKDESSLCKMLKNSSIDTELLLRISFALDYDFASHLSEYFNENKNSR